MRLTRFTALFFMLATIVYALCLPAYAENPTVSQSTVTDTHIIVAGDGSAHVEQHIIVKDLSDTAIITGSMEVRLPGNNSLVYKNINVTTQDFRPVEFQVSTIDDDTVVDIFSAEALENGWQSHIVLTYDVERFAQKSLISDRVAYNNDFSGMSLENNKVDITIPEGAKVTYASNGAAIDGNMIRWSGADAGTISLEYTWLPLPSFPVPVSFVFWGGIMALALVWGFFLKR